MLLANSDEKADSLSTMGLIERPIRFCGYFKSWRSTCGTVLTPQLQHCHVLLSTIYTATSTSQLKACLKTHKNLEHVKYYFCWNRSTCLHIVVSTLNIICTRG